MEKKRFLIGAAVCTSDCTEFEILRGYAGNNIDLAFFSVCDNISDKNYLDGEISVMDIIGYDRFDGFIFINTDVPEGAEKLVPVLKCGNGTINTAELSEFIREICGAFPEYGNVPPPVDERCGIMFERLMRAEDLNGYFQGLGDISEKAEAYVCLYPSEVYRDISGGAGAAENRIYRPCVCRNGNSRLTLSESFDRREMLPVLWEEREQAMVFVFGALHFLNTVYGYSVICLNAADSFDLNTYALRRRYAAAALKIQYDRAASIAAMQIRDPVTGLFNMQGYIRTMTERCEASYGRSIRIVSLEIENPEGIRDSFGEAEYIRVINRIAVIMSGCAGENDICVRMGENEFFIAGITDKDSSEDTLVYELKNAVDSYNSTDSRAYGINIYTSCVTAPISDENALKALPYEASYQRTLSKDSHAKMLGAGGQGGADYDPEERRNVIELINGNLFTYNFQPIVSAKTGEIYAYEILMRSGDKVRISPITILNHAEALGRLYDIEKCTLSNAFKFISEHAEIFKKRYLFINCIPASVLTDEHFEELYNRYGNIMNRAVIEFTEQTEADEDQLKALLDRGSRAGYRIAIDDYGTGYSNISNLLNFMPNYVKIDRSLIMNIHKDKRKQHFTKNIIDYAHDNNFKALAEGVETYEELKTVISMKADLIQGYYTARPAAAPAEEINRDISDEIKEINRKLESRKVRKTYFTGGENEISLMALDFDGYTDVVVNKSRYTFTGSKNYQSETVIRVKDNIDCTIDLVDVSMKNQHIGACISVGEGSRLTLNIRGNVEIAGSICVPERSYLNITGDGSLSLRSSWDHPYAIGADMRSSYGNIEIHLKNRLLIHLDSEKSVAVGGGNNNSNSTILIEADEFVLEQTGKFSLGVGSLSGSAKAVIRNTKFSADMRSADCIAVGSMYGRTDISVENSSFDFNLSGNSTGGVVSYGSAGSSITFRSSSLKMVFRAKDIYGIGARDGEAAMTFVDCDFDLLCEGSSAAAIGSLSEKGNLLLMQCRGQICVNSSNGAAYELKKENVVLSGSDVKIVMNG